MTFDLTRGRLAHTGETQQAKTAHIGEALEKFLEEITDTIGAAEHDPVITAKFGQDLDQRVLGDVLRDRDKRDFDHFRAENLKLLAQFAILIARAGDRDATAEERQLLVPVDLRVVAHDFADKNNGRRAQFGAGDKIGQRGRSADDAALASERGPLHGRGRGVAGQSARNQLRQNLAEMPHAHVDRKRGAF